MISHSQSKNDGHTIYLDKWKFKVECEIHMYATLNIFTDNIIARKYRNKTIYNSSFSKDYKDTYTRIARVSSREW